MVRRENSACISYERWMKNRLDQADVNAIKKRSRACARLFEYRPIPRARRLCVGGSLSAQITFAPTRLI